VLGRVAAKVFEADLRSFTLMELDRVFELVSLCRFTPFTLLFVVLFDDLLLDVRTLSK
jgi:hypothetical protein